MVVCRVVNNCVPIRPSDLPITLVTRVGDRRGVHDPERRAGSALRSVACWAGRWRHCGLLIAQWVHRGAEAIVVSTDRLRRCNEAVPVPALCLTQTVACAALVRSRQVPGRRAGGYPDSEPASGAVGAGACRSAGPPFHIESYARSEQRQDDTWPSPAPAARINRRTRDAIGCSTRLLSPRLGSISGDMLSRAGHDARPAWLACPLFRTQLAWLRFEAYDNLQIVQLGGHVVMAPNGRGAHRSARRVCVCRGSSNASRPRLQRRDARSSASLLGAASWHAVSGDRRPPGAVRMAGGVIAGTTQAADARTCTRDRRVDGTTTRRQADTARQKYGAHAARRYNIDLVALACNALCQSHVLGAESQGTSAPRIARRRWELRSLRTGAPAVG